MKRFALLFVLVGGTLRADELPAHALRKFQVSDPIPQLPIVALAFKPDGKTLISVSTYGGVRLWDVATGKPQQNVSLAPRVAALTPDCSLVALGSYSEGMLLNLGKDAPAKVIQSGSGINALALSPDGSTLAVGIDNHRVEVRDTGTGNWVHDLLGHDAYVTTTAFAPSGKLLATGAHDRTIRLWDPKAGKMIRVLEGHRDQISSLVFLPSGKTLLSSSWDGTIRLWDVETGKEKQCLKGHHLGVLRIGIDVAGKKLASASLDGTARVWDLEAGKETLRIDVAADGVHAVALSADGKLLAAGDSDETVTLWDITGKRLHRWRAAEVVGRTDRIAVHSVVLSPDGSRIVSGHGDTGIRLWDTATGKMIRRVGRMTDYVWSVQFSPDGKHVASAGRRNGTVHIWDADKGELVKTLPGQKGGISKVLYSREGKRLIAAGGSFDPAIYVWDVELEKAIYRLEGHTDYIDAIALSPDEKTLASASRDGALRLWDLTAGKETKQLEAGGICSSLAFAPDGKTLAASGSQIGLTLWDVPSGKLRKRFDRESSSLVHVGYSRDGRTLLLGSTSSLVLLDTLTESERRRIDANNLSVTGLAFSADGRRIVTADTAGSIVLWDPPGLGEKPRKGRLDVEEMDRRWQDLAGQADRAYESIWKLSVAPEQTLLLFAKHLQPVKGTDAKKVERWVADLGSKQFKTRKSAEEELEKLGDLAQAALERGLKKAETLDDRRRIERLLERVTSLSGTPEMLRQFRMVETLEIVGSVEARRLLERLATGDPGAHLTREAKASMSRLPLR